MPVVLRVVIAMLRRVRLRRLIRREAERLERVAQRRRQKVELSSKPSLSNNMDGRLSKQRISEMVRCLIELVPVSRVGKLCEDEPEKHLCACVLACARSCVHAHVCGWCGRACACACAYEVGRRVCVCRDRTERAGVDPWQRKLRSAAHSGCKAYGVVLTARRVASSTRPREDGFSYLR